MSAQLVMSLVLVGGDLALVVWVLHKLGRALASVAEVLLTLASLAVAVRLLIKALLVMIKAAVTHPRTSAAVLVLVGWLVWWGWPSLVGAAGLVAVGLLVWRWRLRASFEIWAGRRLRSWWLRWVVYARKLPGWLRACGLTVVDPDRATVLVMSPFGRNRRPRRQPRPRVDLVPRVLGVRSGASWDEVRVRLVAGQEPEDFDEKARGAGGGARGVALPDAGAVAPGVSVDFQRRNLLRETVYCRELAELVDVPGAAIDLDKVWSGRTEYGTDWHQSHRGSHTLHAGATGAGKGAQMWCPLVSIAPAIGDGLVRVSGIDPKGIDPKGMELAYGRRIFHRYAVTGKDALALLDDLIDEMERRKTEFAGRLRSTPVSRSRRCRSGWAIRTRRSPCASTRT